MQITFKKCEEKEILLNSVFFSSIYSEKVTILAKDIRSEMGHKRQKFTGTKLNYTTSNIMFNFYTL